METMKFLMTTTFYPPYHIGGDAVQVQYLAEELAKRGHEVHVMHSVDAHMMKRGRKEGTPDRERNGVHIHPLESKWGSASTYKTYAFGRSGFIDSSYRALLKEIKPDIVHHHNISLLGASLLEKSGTYRQLYTAHDYWLICQRNDLMRGGGVCDGAGCVWCSIKGGRPPQIWRGSLKLDEIDCIIAPSRYMAEKLGQLKVKIAVLPNFVPDPPKDIKPLGDSGFFLFAGVLEEHKGLRALIEGFSKNGERLVIVGRGSMSAWISSEIERLKLSPRVKLAGWVESTWPYLAAADALVVPSVWPENCPLVALEALSVGTPVICSDMGGTREIVERVDPKLVMPAGALAESIAKIRRPSATREFVRRIFAETYSKDIYIGRYLDIAMEGCASTS
jgi:glycosyltransferase involved in cell wall biosynthesis